MYVDMKKLFFVFLRRQGGSFWQRGHSGALTNYATEVLNEKHNKHVGFTRKLS